MGVVKQKIAASAKRAGFLTGGLLFCAVGAGFLTLAAWLVLVPLVGGLSAASIIGCSYFGVGLVLIGLASRSTEVEATAQPEPAAASTGGPPIMQAFMYGLQAGAQAEKSRSA